MQRLASKTGKVILPFLLIFTMLFAPTYGWISTAVKAEAADTENWSTTESFEALPNAENDEDFVSTEDMEDFPSVENDESTVPMEDAENSVPLESTQPTIPDENTEDSTSAENAEASTTASAPAADYTLKDNEIVVYNFQGLKAALSEDNGYTAIYFGADISMQLGGITIPAAKANILLSGINPLDPMQTAPYTLTEYRSVEVANTIRPLSVGTIAEFRFRDIHIHGYNLFSTFYVPLLPGNAGLTIVYERVNYVGPQMVHHSYGTAHLIDCNVTIQQNDSFPSANNQEFAEAGSLIFQGTNFIETLTANINSVFYYPKLTAPGLFEILENSSLTVIANGYTANRGIFYALPDIDMIIGKNATFRVSTSAPLINTAQGTFRSISVLENGEFYVESTTAFSKYLLQLNKHIQIEKNAVFYLAATNSFSGALIQYSANSQFVANDPERVVLYNPGGLIFQPSVHTITCDISLNAQQVNYWTTAGNGSLDDQPLYRWENTADNVHISATVNRAGTPTIITKDIQHNYNGSGLPPSSDTLNFHNARVLSLGRMTLSLYEPLEASKEITGITAPGAAVRIAYENENGGAILPDVFAGNNGRFAASLDGIPFAKDTSFTAQAAFGYLFAGTAATIQETHTVAVKYADTQGTALAEGTLQSVTKGATFSPEIPVFSGYQMTNWKLDGILQNTTVPTVHRVTADMEITLIFTLEYTFTLRYTDTAGNSLMDATQEQVLAGAAYEKGIPFINGYTIIGYKTDDFTNETVYEATVKIENVAANHILYLIYQEADTQLHISVPIKLIFAAYASDGGQVSSPEYRMENFSTLPVQVSFEGVLADRLEGLTLVQEEPENHRELLLSLIGTQSFHTIHSLQSSLSSPGQIFGVLSPDGSAENLGRFTIGGKYKGTYGTPIQPKLAMIFKFELILPTTQ